MSYSSTLFEQLVQFLPKADFGQYVEQHATNRYVKKLDSWNQLMILLYAQATGKDSLREIETGLTMHGAKWYHLGIATVARSTLSDAMNRRDYHIFEKLFYALLKRCRSMTPQRKFTFKNPLYSLDASAISLCLSLFDWAQCSKTKGALKLHTLLNNRTAIPECLTISTGKVADITAAKKMTFSLETGSILVFDRGYIDYSWWKKIDDNGLYFVTRAKNSAHLFVTGQHQEKITEKGILADELVMLGDYNAMKKEQYLQRFRRIRYHDQETQKEFIFLTNNLQLSAATIAAIYKERWQIELFFKWIKQNLTIKSFLGTSQNAVLSQIWVAMIFYLLLSYIKFQTKFSKSLLEFTRMVKETLLFRQNLIDLLSLNTKTIQNIQRIEYPQMAFF